MALTAEEITASPYFDADAYVAAKARIMVLNGKANSLEAAEAQFLSKWTGDMSEHYLNYGAAENVNPSNDFDNSDYIEQVATAEGVTYQELKADWEAQDIAPLEHFIETGEDLGYTAPAVSADEQVVVGDTPVVEGDDILLTSETDRDGLFDGTSGDDAFDAPIVQNSWAGGVSNSLSTADRLDGGAGSDSLYAELVPEFYGVTGDNQMDVQPRIQSIEDIQFEAMDVSSDSIGNDNDGVITIDAKNITDVDHIGSAYSDGDLLIENLTTLTNDGTIRNTNTITITMDHTDNFNSDTDASDLTVYFDEDYLNTTTETQGSQLTINMINTLNNKLNEVNADSALSLIAGFDTFTFSVGETEIEVDVTGAELFEVKGLIETALTDAGIDTVTVTEYLEPAFFATNIYYEDTDTTYNAGDPAGPDYTAFVLTNSASEDLIEGGFDLANGSRDGSLAYSQDDRIAEIADLPISINVELEKVGRDGEGGNLVIGGKDQNSQFDVDVDQSDGIEVFDITVLGGEDKPSNLGIISSTNGTLTTVIIDSAQSENDTWADLTVRTRLGQGQELTLIDSTDFEGNFALGLSVLDNDGDGVLETVVTGLQEALTSNFGSGDDSYNWQSDEADGVSSGKDYSISMGNGNDVVRADLDGDSVDTTGESFSLDTGSGDDDVTVTMDAGVSQVTMEDLHDADADTFLDYLSISTGGGADTVNLDAYGNFNIMTGDDSDFVQINSLATGNNGNANDGQWVFGPATSSEDTFGDRVLYKAELTVSFAGFESTVVVDTDSEGNFIADQMTINAAIMAAIDQSHELTDLLDYTLGTDSQQLTIDSVIGGANSLAIALYQPEVVASDIDTDDVDAGQVRVSSGDVTALRQGLIDTTTDNSADLAEEDDVIAAIDNGSIDQNGAGDGVTYANIENDTVLDGVDDNNTSTDDQDIFDLAAGDLYQDYADGGSTDSTAGINFSTIDVGDGSNDIVVMHSNHDDSSNVLKISEGFGKVSVVNFHTEPTDAVDSYLDVSDHALDFTTYLTNQDDPSDDPANNTQSVVPVPVTLNIVDDAEAFTDSAANPDATNTNDAVANGVNVLRFDENVDDPDDLQTFDDLTAEILFDALNDDDADSTYGNLDQDLLTPDDFGGDDLQSTTQQHIVMVENDQNEGEYKVFYLTSSVDGDGNVDDESDDGVNQFATAEELGTLDFGASINFNLVGSDEYTELRDDLLDAADGVVDPSIAPVAVDDTFTVDLDAPVLLDVLANDTDADTAQEDLVIAGVQAIDAAQGTVVIQDNQILFDPADGFTGDVTFAYGVSDGTDTDQGSVTVTVGEVVVTQAPVAVDDAFTVAMDAEPTLLDVLLNDTDADTAQEDLVIAGVQAIDAAQGTVVIQDNQILFDPADGFTGDVTFAYGVSDGTDTVTGNVTVTVADDTPNVVDMAAGEDYTATDGVVDVFQYEVDSSSGRAVGKDGEVSITGFNVAEDSLLFVDAGDSLTDTNFTTFDGVSLAENPFADNTAIGFDPDEGVSNLITIAGVQDVALDTIDFMVV